MHKHFVPTEKGYRKLHFAEGTNAAVYLYGATGYGKTRLVKEYLGKKNHIRLSPLDLEWDLSPLSQKSPEERLCIVADDMHLLKDEDRKQLLFDLALRSDVWLLMIGRMQTPLWLTPLITDGRLIVISENDLRLSAAEVKRIADNEQVAISAADAAGLSVLAKGNATLILSVLQRIRSGEVLNDDLCQTVSDVFVNHLETNVIPQWSIHLQEFLMQVSVVEEFTIPLAVMITGDNHAPAMLEEAMGAGNFLQRQGDVYRLRPILIEALRSRAQKVFGVQKYSQYMNNAGLYYEMQNDLVAAIRLYECSGNKDGIRSLLIRSARQHSGINRIHALRRYYLALEEQEIETSPVLMSVMSMLYSIMMNPEQSEYWYDRLKNHAASLCGGEKREANEHLLYLDISLPHRGTDDMEDILRRTAALLVSGGLELPELSITNNQPSTMNGGKDFCQWSKRDQLLADTIGKSVEQLTGRFGRGLTHAALCESFYEKGGRDDEVLHHAIMTQMEVDSGGKTELLFASVGIQVRLSLLGGNVANAFRLLNSYEERVRREGLTHLLPNLNALRCRVALVAGKKEAVEQWLEEAPDEQMEFWTLDRYGYATKVRVYLALGRNADAINLLKRLLYYAEVSKRIYLRMESKLLLAMALRQEKREWKPVLLEALNEIEEYRFVRIISEKGAGILPLLKQIRRDYCDQPEADKPWFEQVVRETTMLADRYPGYLACDAVQLKDFGETALSILKMQSEGMSIREIAAKLDMSERTVKYHAAENYRKLGAKGKTDAVQLAQKLNLL